MATSSLIVQSYLKTFTDGKTNKLRYKQKVKELLKYNRENEGNGFLSPLNYYLSIIETIDPVQFPYMNEAQKEEALRNLRVTFLLLLTQKQYELEYQKTENSKVYTSQISRCHQLIDALQYGKVCKEKKIKPSPDQGYASEGNPVKYLAISFGQWFAEKMVGYMDRKTKTIKEHMGSFNEKRLYWVWGGGLIKTFLELIPADYWNVEQGRQTVKMPDPYTGTLSWSLYYFRFALNFSLLLKHTIQGSWMTSEAEKSTPWQKRFLTQWDQRKFTLLNDFVWATGNALCFFWLYGSGTLGSAGDALTLALLVFDITLAVWEFAEEQTKYNKEMLDYENHIKRLELQLEGTKKDAETAEGYSQRIREYEGQLQAVEVAQAHSLAEDPDNSEELLDYENQIKRLKLLLEGTQKAAEAEEQYARRIREYQAQLNALKKAQKQCQREWEHKKRILIVNVSYAVGLMLAFFLLTAPFLPALAAAGPAGAVLCLALTVICNAIKGGMEIHKTRQSIKETKEEIKNKIDEFKRLMKENPDMDDKEKKFLFLEIKKLMAESKYQRQTVTLQAAHLLRSIIFETFVPAIILVNLIFLPMGPAFWGVIAAVIGLAFLTNFLINHFITPEKEALKPLNAAEYAAFCQNPEQWVEKTSKSQTFFKSSEKPSTAKEPQQDESEEDLDLSFLNSGLSGQL
ncbi:hypothetical protein [Legionella maioricensis]|uniref:Coiled-coil protein n=1 Tax=Legionella maioricensis TaxID=2896528 RepID=A0A9X2CYA1_9GAMM|nr:hypothetical protein [Legionella maioricensis]MCL9682991.1 hypothetical protein [Legionella maioricensis]MCL9686339.1 hypothetical protein [Legionella maioricensis]